jgi:enoyl-CoA hydratase/carnithine racemase
MPALKLHKDGPIAYIVLARPEEGNPVDYLLLAELADACEAIEPDPEVRVVLLWGGEGEVFSRGWRWEGLLEGEEWPGWPPTGAFDCLAELPRPVVCAINGDAFSAGLELALACDVRIAAPGARFAFPETALGLIPLAGGTQRLARAVGRSWASYLVLTGEAIDAQQALAMGLVSAVVERERLLGEAESIARRIAEKGPLAVRYAKEALQRGPEMPLEEALRYETDLTIILQTTADRQEGVRAFLEKRRPRFSGT